MKILKTVMNLWLLSKSQPQFQLLSWGSAGANIDVIQNVALAKKDNLICSEMCFCQDCENQPIFSEELSLNDNENEDNENGTDDIDDWDY